MVDKKRSKAGQAPDATRAAEVCGHPAPSNVSQGGWMLSRAWARWAAGEQGPPSVPPGRFGEASREGLPRGQLKTFPSQLPRTPLSAYLQFLPIFNSRVQSAADIHAQILGRGWPIRLSSQTVTLSMQPLGASADLGLWHPGLALVQPLGAADLVAAVMVASAPTRDGGFVACCRAGSTGHWRPHAARPSWPRWLTGHGPSRRPRRSRRMGE